MDYKDTLNLPKTTFPMRGNLPQKEPAWVEKWEREGIHEKMVEANRGAPKFILHDGPPYANERIHIGHALNKVLKDIIIKYKSMRGYCTPYIPGWDCHGLPIELQVEKSLGREKKNRLSKVEVRKLCRAHAEKFIGVQREEFKRLGVLGRWAEPYRTIDFEYEATEVRELGKFMASGSMYRSKKPVYWCASCATALAEAEVEYDNQRTPSVYVKFPIKDAKGKLPDDGDGAFAIWTTTPWTLPANQAIALHPLMRYRRVRTPAGVLVVAEELATSLMEAFGYETGAFEVLEGSWSGAELEGIVCSHAWLDRDVIVILGEFVTADQGTGCVHVAPGHGHEDFEAGQRYGLDAYAPVDDNGRFTADAGEFQGEMVFDANPRIVARLEAAERLLGSQDLDHSYPHCWRCKQPVLFRATEQWFISMAHTGLRQGSLDAIEQVQWIPPWGQDRITGMMANRPDWCISRQRSWGVPIPVLYCMDCDETLLSEVLCEHVAGLFEREGSDAWFLRPPEELAPPGFRCRSCGSARFSKEEDILDVWFDSGVSHAAVVERHPELGGRADLYLEGSDQHRGWFHTSLLTSVANRGRAPYDGVLTHGFVLDGKGHKMSKSVGNVTAPQEIIKKFGADIIRLWVAAEDYRDDVRISDEILNRLVESYRRLRNTARFLIGNLNDFDPSTDAVSADALEPLDRWILDRTQRLLGRCLEALDRFEFHAVYHALNNYCSVDLSSLYLDIVKDRLYCEGRGSTARRSAQTALHKILQTLVHLMAPILSFTAEEIWEHAPGSGGPDSILLSPIPEPDDSLLAPALAAEWDLRLNLRGEVLKALEVARQCGAIGHSLDAKVVLYPDVYHNAANVQELLRADAAMPWEDVFIVSQVSVAAGEPSGELVYPEPEAGDDAGEEGAGDAAGKGTGYESALLGGAIGVYPAGGVKCERCWKYHEAVGEDAAHPGVCPRCVEVLRSLPQAESARA